MATKETLAFVTFLGLTMASACAAEDPPTGPPVAPPDTTSTGPTTPTGTGGEGGMGEGGSMGGAGGSEPEPVTCMGDFAYRADGMSFAAPTPTALADALAEHIGDDDHPITVVLRSADAGATVGASFALDGGTAYQFPAPLTPTFTDAMVEGGLFYTMAPAAQAFARIRHDDGVLDLGLVDVDLDATTERDCGLAQVSLEATIPASLRSETIVGSAGSATIGELAGGNDNDDIPIAANFTGTSVSFDFDSLDQP
ncbi:MAG: hypothetical protein RIF41_18040 [Polyangiaceae bacterium]